MIIGEKLWPQNKLDDTRPQTGYLWQRSRKRWKWERGTWTKTDTCSNGAICQNVFVLMIESFYIISQLWDGNLISGDDDDHRDDDLDVIGHCWSNITYSSFCFISEANAGLTLSAGQRGKSARHSIFHKHVHFIEGNQRGKLIHHRTWKENADRVVVFGFIVGSQKNAS